MKLHIHIQKIQIMNGGPQKGKNQISIIRVLLFQFLTYISKYEDLRYPTKLLEPY